MGKKKINVWKYWNWKKKKKKGKKKKKTFKNIKKKKKKKKDSTVVDSYFVKRCWFWDSISI